MIKHKIKIGIAGREYPMHVTSGEEEILRKAAKIIKDLVDDFGEKYELKDTQDALAMCSLQFVAKDLYNEDMIKANSVEIAERLKNITEKIEKKIH